MSYPSCIDAPAASPPLAEAHSRRKREPGMLRKLHTWLARRCPACNAPLVSWGDGGDRWCPCCDDA